MNKLSATIIAAALTASLSSVALAQDSSSMAPGAAYGTGITDNPSANRDGDLNGPAAGLGGEFRQPSENGLAQGAEMGYGVTENPSANKNSGANAPAAGNGGDFGATNSGSTEGQVTGNPSANHVGEDNAPATGNGGDFTPNK
jgi:hypothetical protein